jgi:hypothetical protein
MACLLGRGKQHNEEKPASTSSKQHRRSATVANIGGQMSDIVETEIELKAEDLDKYLEAAASVAQG